MRRKIWYIVLVPLFVLLLAGIALAAEQEPFRQDTPGGGLVGVQVRGPSEVSATTYITVASTADDPSDGYSKKCSDADVGYYECTLRRAINQAYGLSAGDRPVHIVFDIPISDTGYISTTEVPGAWKIKLAGTVGDDLRELYGDTILDGSTQHGGRDDGYPKIIIDGQGNKNYGFILRQDGNEVRGVAMQNFKTAHISVSSDNNLVEECWFGLSDDGMHLSAGDDLTYEGGSGVALAAGSDGNTVQNNVFAGFFGVAAAIRGDNNVFSGNWVGTRADGTVPIPAQFDQHPCLKGAWVGGVGITVSDNENQIEDNVFAGLFIDVGLGISDQKPAMDVIGEGHTIQNNVIGLDGKGNLVGVCGRGLDFGGEPKSMMVADNTIVETGLSAILMNGPMLNGNTLRRNIIRRATDWPGEQGFNTFPEDAIAYGATVPDALKTFEPAKVTEINGATVSGTSGDGSPCANCVVELFRDDADTVTETLESLAVVAADASGNWTADIGGTLETGQGIRTTSTVSDTFTIIGLDAGTTSNLSALYGAEFEIFLPLVVRNG